MADKMLGIVRVACRLRDPSLPVAVMAFHTLRVNEGGTLIAVPATDESLWAECERIRAEHPHFDVVALQRLRASDLPADRRYRNAWQLEGEVITHNIDKVKAIAIARLREERGERLEALDRDFTRALGQEDAAAAKTVEAERQRLRDLPALAAEAIAAATTVAEVEAALPSINAIEA